MVGETARPEASQPMVVMRDLTLRDLRMSAYEHVTLSLDAGRAHALCAEDKGGKTELLLTMAGLLKPSSGSCLVAGNDVATGAGRRAVRRMAGVSFFDHVNDVERVLRVRTIASAELSLAGRRSDRAATRAFLNEWGLAEQGESTIEELARFDYDWLGIALAMAHDPQLLLVDDIESDLTEHETYRLRERLLGLAHDRRVTVACGVIDYDVASGFDSVTCITDQAKAQHGAWLRRHAGHEEA